MIFDHKAGSCYVTLPRLGLSHMRGNDRELYYLVTGDVFGILQAFFHWCAVEQAVTSRRHIKILPPLRP